jgi:hypothetical protein
LFYGLAAMQDELVIEEMAVRAIQERVDEAFRAAMQRAIDTGEENTPTVVSKKPGTKNPRVVYALAAKPAGVLVDACAVALIMLSVRAPDRPQQFAELVFPLLDWRRAQVLAVQLDQIEGA